MSKVLEVPKNVMFIACPNGPFPYNVASLGGVRVITATHHQTVIEIDVKDADYPTFEAHESVIVDDGTSDGAVINISRKNLAAPAGNTSSLSPQMFSAQEDTDASLLDPVQDESYQFTVNG